MRVVKAADLARNLGISRRTVADWCKKRPDLAIKRAGSYWIRLDALANSQGLDLVQAFMLAHTKQHWIKAIDIAKNSNIPRRTIAHWCKTRPHLAKRIGRNWYIAIEDLDAHPRDAQVLRKWAPKARTTAALLEYASERIEQPEASG